MVKVVVMGNLSCEILGFTTEKGGNRTLTKKGKIEPLSQLISIFVIPRMGAY
jgi:hypothetical protein